MTQTADYAQLITEITLGDFTYRIETTISVEEAALDEMLFKETCFNGEDHPLLTKEMSFLVGDAVAILKMLEQHVQFLRDYNVIK